MIVEATAKRAIAITNGWAADKPIFVAADADAHNIANTTPAKKYTNRWTELFTALKLIGETNQKNVLDGKKSTPTLATGIAYGHPYGYISTFGRNFSSAARTVLRSLK